MDNVCYPCRLIYAGYLDRARCDICHLPLRDIDDEKSAHLNSEWSKKGDSIWYRFWDWLLG